MIRSIIRSSFVFLLLVAAGCAGGPKPGTTTVGEPGPWQVQVVGADGDTVSVPTGVDAVPAATSHEPAPSARAATPAGDDASAARAAGGAAAVTAAEGSGIAGDTAPERAPRETVGASTAGTAAGTAAPQGMDDFTYGYRIQVMAASSLTVAEGAAARADSLFALASYVEYEPPFYKVRLGDFLLKDLALSAMDGEVKREFPRAWVAETMVLRPAR